MSVKPGHVASRPVQSPLLVALGITGGCGPGAAPAAQSGLSRVKAPQIRSVAPSGTRARARISRARERAHASPPRSAHAGTLGSVTCRASRARPSRRPAPGTGYNSYYSCSYNSYYSYHSSHTVAIIAMIAIMTIIINYRIYHGYNSYDFSCTPSPFWSRSRRARSPQDPRRPRGPPAPATIIHIVQYTDNIS